MAAEIENRMKEHGRASDLTNVVYKGAGHVFLIREFIPPAMFGVGGLFDYGGSPEADSVAGSDAWRRIGEFLRRPTS